MGIFWVWEGNRPGLPNIATPISPLIFLLGLRRDLFQLVTYNSHVIGEGEKELVLSMCKCNVFALHLLQFMW